MNRIISRVAVAAITLASLTGQAFGQADQSDQDVLRDFIHFVKISRFDAADLYGRELLSRGITERDFVQLLEDGGELSRFDEAVALAERRPELEPTASALRRLYQDGKLAIARDPAEIAASIALLQEGRARGVLLARERLAQAGEYAMPQLLEALLTGGPSLKSQVSRLMTDMGRQAATPLATALPGLDPAQQQLVLTILGNIPVQNTAPAILDLLGRTQSEEVRREARRALGKLDIDPATTPASAYLALAEGYYDERLDLTNFRGEQFQLLWDFDPSVGLLMTAIDTSVYHEAVAMRHAETSLTLEPQGPVATEAMAAWVAANLSREIDSPEEYANPAYGSDRREAQYFAVASGVQVVQRVLARGIEDQDTPLIRRAIAAIDRTAGASSLAADPAGLSPLVSALGYPNRRVQIEAALAFGKAQPRQTFVRSERVVPILAAAVRDSATRYAAVVADDAERYASIRERLEGEGFSVLPRVARVGELRPLLGEVPALDLLVSSLSGGATSELIDQVSADGQLGATPILAMLDTPSYTSLRRRYEADVSVTLRPNGLSDSEFVSATRQLIEDAAGGSITRDEAEGYAGRSLAVLRDLAVEGNTVLDVSDAALPLIAALNESAGGRQLRVAEVLSRIAQPRAQVALMDAAINGSGPIRLAMLEKTAESARRFGDMLTDAQRRQLVEFAQSTDSAEATEAAGLMGALDLPNDFLLRLILREG
ncbi:MAG: hypothetical protein AAGB51_12730 [Planctomycetota bacterium]